MKNNLEKLCIIKKLTLDMIQPLEEKYQHCFYCSGLNIEKYCYVEPYERRKNDKKKEKGY